ncbi:mitochondrial protein Pet127-domain-containing protein [Umbelopsis sp. PMI_123]|nr:mitochondrial protein Pet127-domain-containing protein [Umbelopsis sp. PMI_123]
MLVLQRQVLRCQRRFSTPRNGCSLRCVSQSVLRLDHVKESPATSIESELEQEKDVKHTSDTESISVARKRRKRLADIRNEDSATKNNEEQHWEEIKHMTFPYKRVMSPNNVKVDTLAHGLDRVLFNPGVHVLQDPRTKVYNFTPFLQNITQPKDFDYDALAPYITSSRDSSLRDMAKQLGKQYVGSTSSISAALSQIYFMLSNFRPVDTSPLSNDFQKESKKFTRGVRTPASIFLRYQDGVYAIDADKSHDVQDGILSVLGKSMEKVLTLPPSKYEKYLRDASEKVSEEEKHKPEAYAYGQIGKFLLRSQLDCYHSKLPKKVFDLKTRAVIPIRMDQANYTNYLGYSLTKQQGMVESFEREYYDMIRAAFLKYSFQARIGHMDGIFVAYHNTAKVFGFQYISLEEIDSRIFGNSATGNTAFRHTVSLMEKILDTATKQHPDQTLRISLHARQSKDESRSWLNVFTEVVPPDIFEDNSKLVSHVLQPYDSLSKYVVQAKSYIDGNLNTGDIKLHPKGFQKWDIEYSIRPDLSDASTIDQQFRFLRRTQAMTFGPSNKAGVSTYLKHFQEISDQYLRLEKIEYQKQLMDSLRAHYPSQIAKAWKELQSNEKFKKDKLRYLSKHVLHSLKDHEIKRLIKEYNVEGGKVGLQNLAAERRASVLQTILKDAIPKSSTHILRKASFDLGLRVNRSREDLEKQLEEILIEGGVVTKPTREDKGTSERGPSQNTNPQVNDTATESTAKPSLLQRLKAFAQSKSSDT